jgi:hypothetical protein
VAPLVAAMIANRITDILTFNADDFAGMPTSR